MTKDKNNPLFNTNVKENFLATVNEKSLRNYSRIFSITQEFEKSLNKDLNTFTKEEMEEVLFGFNSKTRNTIESYGRIISSYLNWSVETGLITENVLKSYTPDDFEKFIKDNQEYLTEKRLRRYEDDCENYQDAVLLRLLFIGVGGKKLSEIRNLKKTDIIDKNTLRLTDTLKEDKHGNPEKYTERYMTVDERTMYLIEGAIKQRKYMKKNGMISQTEKDNIRPYTDLIDNDYVLRPSNTRTETFNVPTDIFVIYRRIQMLAESFGVEDFNTKSIQRSGMLYMANDIIKDDKVTLEDLKIIADKFSIKSYHNLKGFITLENIRKLYPNLNLQS